MKRLIVTEFLGLLALVTMSGCMGYRTITFHVQDAGTKEPVGQAAIQFQSSPAFASFNAGHIPMFQTGTTDDQGNWKCTVSDRGGLVSVSKPGFSSSLIDALMIEEHFRKGAMTIELSTETTKPAKEAK